jgi:hypothetical protein
MSLNLNSLRSFAPLVCVLILSTLTASAHPDKVESQLLTHFATGTHQPENGQWQDITHRATAKIVGAPIWTNVGPAQAIVFNGVNDYLLLGESPAAAKEILPVKEFSVAAWIMVNDASERGGIAGLFRDSRTAKQGWAVGYTKTAFGFALATKGAGGNKATTLSGQTAPSLGQWQHVAATYDGQRMRLYVNGKLDAESAEQSGDISYPEAGQYLIGAWADGRRMIPMDGAIYEAKVYGRALAQEEITATVEKNRGLINYRSPINSELQFVVKPYLQFATADSIKILCETTKPSTMLVQYGERQPLTLTGSSTAPANISEVALKDFKPNTTYFYRVTCTDANGNIARSDIATFQGLPGPDSAWAFGILGDTQRNPEVTRKCAEAIFALRPNFMIHCGDVVDDGFAKHQWVDDLFDPCSRLFAHVPAFPVIGNHEKNSHWYYDYFSLPDPEYFYTFKVGNAEFFMIDSNKDCRPGSEQYARLEKALANSKSVWKFTAHHHPCFSSDENDYGDKWTGKLRDEEFGYGNDNAQPLVPLYEKYGVDISFAGHIHSYERTWPILQMTINQKKGVRYIVSGGGGGGLEQAAPQRAWFSIHVQRGHHFAFATVHDRTIQFKAYDIEGRLFDTFELTKPEDR